MIWLALSAVTALLLGFAVWRAAPSAKAMRHDWAYQSCGPACEQESGQRERKVAFPAELDSPHHPETQPEVATGPQDLVERDAA